MASYVDSQSSQTLQPRKAPGLFIYECTGVTNPATIANVEYANAQTQPNNSYWPLWNVNDQTRNSIISDDPTWAAGWSVSKPILWPIDSRTLVVPYTGLYSVSLRVVAGMVEQLGTNDLKFSASYAVYSGNVLAGVVKDIPAKSGTFLPADGTHPDPLSEGGYITWHDQTTSVDYTTIQEAPATEAVVCAGELITPPRPVFPGANASLIEGDPQLNVLTVQGTAYLQAGQQLRCVVSNYNQCAQAAVTGPDRITYANCLYTPFAPGLFNLKLTYINGAYKV